jgi:hypothetical protein
MIQQTIEDSIHDKYDVACSQATPTFSMNIENVGVACDEVRDYDIVLDAQ